jgi:choline dehydrogenase-like flavoprotein
LQLEAVTGGWHHMGTTRMNDNPRQGVVDSNSRVHGLSNLYIAGPSVFPTGGYANPCLTLVALTLRLSDHLKMLNKY